MNRRFGLCMGSGLLSLTLGLLALVGGSFQSKAGTKELTFESLQVGTQTYKNVTVTTKARNYVFILHSDGMTNLKVSELPADVLEKLGYENPNVPKVATNGPSVWAKQTIAKLDAPEVKQAQEELKSKWNASPAGAKLPFPEINRTLLLEVAGVLLVLYLLHCLCCMLICKKADSKPGVLVWLPVLQLFPLLRAAKMSYWWFLAYFVPVLGIVAQILWCFKIADARGKTPFVGFLLAFPLTSPLAFLYLAFSAGVARIAPSSPARKRPIEIMTLEAA